MIYDDERKNGYDKGWKEGWKAGFDSGREELLKDQPQIVRCKDCGNRFSTNCPFYMMQMETKDDFYCADGEKSYMT